MLAFLAAFALTLQSAAQGNDYFVYFGTYTGFKYVHHSKTWGVGESKSKGIYVSRFNASTGQLGEPQLAAEVVNPSFLTISPDHHYLYAISEDPLSIGPPVDHSSYVSAFAIDSATGTLRFLNSVPASGTSTCYISIDKTVPCRLLSPRRSTAIVDRQSTWIHVGNEGRLPTRENPKG